MSTGGGGVGGTGTERVRFNHYLASLCFRNCTVHQQFHYFFFQKITPYKNNCEVITSKFHLLFPQTIMTLFSKLVSQVICHIIICKSIAKLLKTYMSLRKLRVQHRHREKWMKMVDEWDFLSSTEHLKSAKIFELDPQIHLQNVHISMALFVYYIVLLTVNESAQI